MDRRPRSDGHLLARSLLLKLFPFDPPYEEVRLPGCPTELFLDFLLPQRRLALEVQGRQHREYVPHFHRTPAGYMAARKRDAMKLEFCELNGLILLELNDDDRTGWESAIRNAFARPGVADGAARTA